MKCKKCGAVIPNDSNFCGICGTPVGNNSEETKIEGNKVSENIYIGKDGKYRWCYEYKMFRNPTILFTVFRVLALSMFIVYLFVCCVTIFGYHHDLLAQLWDITKVFVALIAFMLFLGAISYAIYSWINGGVYCVMFEMDEEGVTHTQMPKQFTKAQGLAKILTIVGAAKGNIGAVGQGMLIKGHQSLSSSWNSVKNIKINKNLNTIKVNELLSKNQVYAEDADFDFVADFIKKHVNKKCKIYE